MLRKRRQEPLKKEVEHILSRANAKAFVYDALIKASARSTERHDENSPQEGVEGSEAAKDSSTDCFDKITKAAGRLDDQRVKKIKLKRVTALRHHIRPAFDIEYSSPAPPSASSAVSCCDWASSCHRKRLNALWPSSQKDAACSSHPQPVHILQFQTCLGHAHVLPMPEAEAIATAFTPSRMLVAS
ncbi:hypothetical protein CYMTET_23591 [Cymbomonas tetramitiformis]|uniref:Uncharacterized protein n=1 Tax=Cymbomonas tetramitiformis TaxID=36881 RepID=A0AAE0FZ06_9CHLO|nr:hypothetical protein CYMTET_23591 [Cymbomonas tetramitiformis]